MRERFQGAQVKVISDISWTKDESNDDTDIHSKEFYINLRKSNDQNDDYLLQNTFEK